MASYAVRLKDGTTYARVRSPVWSVVFSMLSLGVYGAYWWYQVNRELRDLGRVHERSDLGTSPVTSLLAVVPGFIVIVPPFVSLYKGFQRVRAAQDLAGLEERDRLNGWIGLLVVVMGLATFIPFVVAFVQSELNKVWASEVLAEAPGGAIPPTPAVATPPVPAPPAQDVATAHAPQQPPVRAPDPQLDRLERLAALRDSGALTADEYEAQKAAILAEL